MTQDEANNALLQRDSVGVLVNADVMTNFMLDHPEVVRVGDIPISYTDNGFDVSLIYALLTKHQIPDELLYDKINHAILKLHVNGFIVSSAINSGFHRHLVSALIKKIALGDENR